MAKAAAVLAPIVPIVMKSVMRFQVMAKVSVREYKLELCQTRGEAERLCEEYARGNECAWAEPDPAGSEKPGQICVTYFPVHRLDAVYVIPCEVGE